MGKLTLDHHSRLPTGPINHSTGVSHPKSETYGPIPVLIPEKGESLTDKTLIEPKQTSGTRFTICGKGHGPSCSLIEHPDSNNSAQPLTQSKTGQKWVFAGRFTLGISVR